jgi:Phosphate-starvation-inducible E family
MALPTDMKLGISRLRGHCGIALIPSRSCRAHPVSAPLPAESGSKASAFIDETNGTRHPLDVHPWRESIMRGFIGVEDAVYAGLGTLLAAMVLALLVVAIVEILYTVQVSFSEHALVPEPFLIVGLIAAIRRFLVLTAEFGRLVESNSAAFRGAVLELGLLTVMIVALVVSLVVLKRHPPHGS